MAHFFEPILSARDRGGFTYVLYSNFHLGDAVTERLRACADDWREVWRLTDDALIELIRNDRIDVLIDLSGHTAFNRLTVFARRAAPYKLVIWGIQPRPVSRRWTIASLMLSPIRRYLPMIGIASAYYVCLIRNGVFGRSERRRRRVRCPHAAQVS